MFIVSAFSYLIQPVASYEGYDQLCSRVQQRSLENTLDGCRLLIHATRHLSKMEDTKSCRSFFLFFFRFSYEILKIDKY